jgi:hypothetical protein
MVPHLFGDGCCAMVLIGNHQGVDKYFGNWGSKAVRCVQARLFKTARCPQKVDNFHIL